MISKEYSQDMLKNCYLGVFISLNCKIFIDFKIEKMRCSCEIFR
jgi:hypothetical protein